MPELFVSKEKEKKNYLDLARVQQVDLFFLKAIFLVNKPTVNHFKHVGDLLSM